MTSGDLDDIGAGLAFADLSSWRKVLVRGSEARGWLNDLLTADIANLGSGKVQRTLLLTPTGRIQADLSATVLDEGILLLQDAEQPTPIDRLLARYVLSSDVDLEDRSDALSLAAFLTDPVDPPRSIEGAVELRPSVLHGPFDLLGPPGLVSELLRVGFLNPADPATVDQWRILEGVPRFPVDLTTDSLPHETWLGDAVAYDKGCYLGQEAVAKVRNLGHPPFVVLPGQAEGPAAVGDEVLAQGTPTGRVTSAANSGQGTTAVIVRVRWAARDQDLVVRNGSPIRIRRSAPA